MSPHEDPPPAHEDAARARESDRDDGVDVSLIRWMLSLTPRERLQVLQDHVRATLALRVRLS